jgi:hypothetical protein
MGKHGYTCNRNPPVRACESVSSRVCVRACECVCLRADADVDGRHAVDGRRRAFLGFSEYSQGVPRVLTRGSQSTDMGYSQYSRGVLGVLTADVDGRHAVGGRRRAFLGFSEYSQAVPRVLTRGSQSTHKGYSQYSRGVLGVLTADVDGRDAVGGRRRAFAAAAQAFDGAVAVRHGVVEAAVGGRELDLGLSTLE